jgi:hypothetical protein
MAEKKAEKKRDLRDSIYGREDLSSETRKHALGREDLPDRSEPDVTKPWPDNSTVPEGQTTKGGI